MDSMAFEKISEPTHFLLVTLRVMTHGEIQTHQLRVQLRNKSQNRILTPVPKLLNAKCDLKVTENDLNVKCAMERFQTLSAFKVSCCTAS